MPKIISTELSSDRQKFASKFAPILEMPKNLGESEVNK